MFWKLIVLALLVWAVAMYFSVTLGGMIHLIPIGALVFVVVRRMGRNPDTEFGRWRPASERTGRR
jgi:F0F1-type ATP synthase assembly protein I